MSEIFDIPAALKSGTYINESTYQELYAESVKNPEDFWAKRAEEFLTWDKKWDKVLEWDYHKANIQWFHGAKLNVSANCLDRHLSARGNKTAILWEGNEPGEVRRISYKELHEKVSRFANVLKKHGVEKGDRVAIYMPMVPETAMAMLACARIGAVHSVVFGGFSAESLRDRINDCQAKVLVTANVGLRGAKTVELLDIADEALEACPSIKSVLIHARTRDHFELKKGRDFSLDTELSSVSPECPPVSCDSEDPLFILYTSGSTGKPKGVLHTQGGYLLYAAVTHKYVFDYRENDVYCCAADVGWVTGHSYIVYGPLCNGATTVMFESLPNYPDSGRYWDMVERHKINIFYTAPTAIRAIAKDGDELVKRYNRSSLRVLGSVGEPINRDAWLWYFNVVGEKRCPIVDTWWQTETGGVLISPLPGATKTKPGSATRPFFGVQPCLVDEQGKEIEGNGVKGRLCIKFPWPGQMRTVYGDHKRFFETYFQMYPGYYFTGDGCTRDEDGYYWITGRVDDVLNVSGHRVGTAEIESAIVSSGIVAEAAVVGMPHEIKGTGIFAYCIPLSGVKMDAQAVNQVKEAVRRVIGPFAAPDIVQFIPGLPKTRSGKIMRRILRKIAEGEFDSLGDTSTLADPAVVQQIVQAVAMGMKR